MSPRFLRSSNMASFYKLFFLYTPILSVLCHVAEVPRKDCFIIIYLFIGPLCNFTFFGSTVDCSAGSQKVSNITKVR